MTQLELKVNRDLAQLEKIHARYFAAVLVLSAPLTVLLSSIVKRDLGLPGVTYLSPVVALLCLVVAWRLWFRQTCRSWYLAVLLAYTMAIQMALGEPLLGLIGLTAFVLVVVFMIEEPDT